MSLGVGHDGDGLSPSDFRPVPPSEWPAELDGLRGSFAATLNVYRTMAHHPRLLTAWAALRDHLVVHSALGAELAEVVILRASRHLHSAYERAHHIVRARKVGMSDERIYAVLEHPRPANAADAAVTDAVDELMEHHRLSPEALALLGRHLTREGVLDLIALVGFYTTLGHLLNSFGTPLDPDIADALACQPLRADRSA